MKISDDEVKAALDAWFGYKRAEGYSNDMRKAIAAALKVRRRLKKERKDKQVGVSVKPEWHGTFGWGSWETRNGRLAVVNEVNGNKLIGQLYSEEYEGGAPTTWDFCGFLTRDRQTEHDLIRPWPRASTHQDGCS